jgi:GntR family transcriptional regulator/MocR family aminotransferase
VYLTPHHQYPTMAVLAARRRLALLALARRHRFAIIEDDYDHEYHYEGRPILPLASADRGGCVVYVGTLSKVLAPGLRIGYVVAPRPLVERLAAIRALIDHQGDIAVEAAVAELMEDGELQRHVRRMRRVYHARRDALIDALRDQLGDAVSFDVPPGGMALWIHAPDLDVDAWAARAKAAGVLFTPGRRVSFHGRATPYARLGYACVTEDEIRRAVGILRRTARG